MLENRLQAGTPSPADLGRSIFTRAHRSGELGARASIRLNPREVGAGAAGDLGGLAAPGGELPVTLDQQGPCRGGFTLPQPAGAELGARLGDAPVVLTKSAHQGRDRPLQVLLGLGELAAVGEQAGETQPSHGHELVLLAESALLQRGQGLAVESLGLFRGPPGVQHPRQVDLGEE